MKACFIIPGFSDGGAQKQCIYLLNELQSRPDVEVSLIRFHVGEIHDHLLRTDRLVIHNLPSRSNYDPRNVLRAARIVRRTRPHLLMSWLHACDVYSFAIRALNPGLRWIMTERDSSYPAEPRFWLRQLLGRHADAIVSNSEAGSRLWEELDAKGRRFVVDNIAPQIVNPPARPRSLAAVFVGRLEAQKNPLVVAEAFCLVAARRPGLQFAIVGKGSLAGAIEQVLTSRGSGGQVKLLGFRQDAAELIGDAQMLVTLSHHEGQPGVVIEAVAAGTPIVASDISQHTQVLGRNYPYYVADRGDAAKVADTIEIVLSAADAQGHLSHAAAKLKSMTPREIANRYMDIFRAVERELP